MNQGSGAVARMLLYPPDWQRFTIEEALRIPAGNQRSKKSNYRSHTVSK